MIKVQETMLSVVVPLYNEGQGLSVFHADLCNVLESNFKGNWEVLYCDDGSTDNTAEQILHWHDSNPQVKLIRLSRNFGKENALSAGIASSTGEAIITLDGDGQHPVELIPKFVNVWKSGAQVVIGIRSGTAQNDLLKRTGSRMFYKMFNQLTGQNILPGSTDYRLIDRQVQTAFMSLKETGRITRGLIDWLGFKREYIHFKPNLRSSGIPGYSLSKLMQLAANSFVSMSPKPLYMFGYLGVFITSSSLLLGILVFIEQLLLGDPFGWRFTGTAMLGILIIFLVGIVLMSQGILSLYISHIHSQSKNRPLYVIDYKGSAGINESKKH